MKILLVYSLLILVISCSPKVQIQAPDKPIEINLNVKVEQHIKIEMQKDVQKAISNNPNIF